MSGGRSFVLYPRIDIEAVVRLLKANGFMNKRHLLVKVENVSGIASRWIFASENAYHRAVKLLQDEGILKGCVK